MNNNWKIVVGITFLDHTDLDVMMDLKYKLGNELYRCTTDKIMAIHHNEDLLQLVYNWTDSVISDLIKNSNMPALKKLKLDDSTDPRPTNFTDPRPTSLK